MEGGQGEALQRNGVIVREVDTEEGTRINQSRDNTWSEGGTQKQTEGSSLPEEQLSFNLSFLEDNRVYERAEELVRRSPESDVQAECDRSSIASRDIQPNEELIEIEDNYAFSDESIELSSDDEENVEDQDVILEVLKRPAAVPAEAQNVECLEILDSDEEFPVYEGGETRDNVNIEEKIGYIQEYVEIEGQGIIFSKEFGLVLFHLRNVWVNGQQLPCWRAREMLPVGTSLHFYDQSFEGDQYEALSNERVFHQALVVWHGPRPKHLLKFITNIGEPYRQELETDRKNFLMYLKGEVFIRADLVRVKGTVVGYLTDHIGIIEVNDQEGHKKKAFFHSEDVFMFKKPLAAFNAHYKYKNYPPGHLLPVGLNVSVDAREIRLTGMRNLDYHALLVLAGPWPMVPKPSLLPGGKGTFSPAYETPSGRHTFYYLELQLESRLTEQVKSLKEVLCRTRGVLQYRWDNVACLRNKEDRQKWRDMFGDGEMRRNQPERETGEKRTWEKRAVETVFKAPPIRKFKTKDEFDGDDLSLAANDGDSVRPPSWVSGVASVMSRPYSSSSLHSQGYDAASNASGFSSKSRIRAGSVRSWYNGDAEGCLHIKNEIKQEGYEDDTACPSQGSINIKAEMSENVTDLT